LTRIWIQKRYFCCIRCLKIFFAKTGTPRTTKFYINCCSSVVWVPISFVSIILYIITNDYCGRAKRLRHSYIGDNRLIRTLQYWTGLNRFGGTRLNFICIFSARQIDTRLTTGGDARSRLRFRWAVPNIAFG